MQPYVILAPDHIGEVMRGERTTLPVSVPAEIGTVIALKTGPRRKATCLMDVADCQRDAGGYVITLRPHVYDDDPRLLHDSHHRPPAWASDEESGQYTFVPVFAMGGSLDPGEAVEPELQDQFTLAALGRDAKRRRATSLAAKRDRELLSIVERIELAKAAARENRVVIHSEVKAITRMQANGRSDGLVDQQLERIERLAHRDAA